MNAPIQHHTLQNKTTENTRLLEAVIIGSGFGGLGMGIALRKLYIRDFLILEKAADIGGVWRDNSYPGAACDVPSHLYSFSFEPNPNWTHAFARQPEIHAYLKHCADKYDLNDHIRFNSEVESAWFDEQDSIWLVRLRTGQLFKSRLLITAMGQLSRPAYPSLKGIDRFKGPSFHSAQWRHDADLTGKKVAVVGTGASAIQFVPEVVKVAGLVHLFQRTPSYILPRPDRRYSEREKQLWHKYPWLMKLYRLRIYTEYESRALAFTRFKKLLEFGVGRPFKAMLKRHVKDDALRAKLTPDYPIGCKRILLSSDYLKAMSAPNLNLITESIDTVTETGIATRDGKHHDADVIVYGTGFAATQFLAPLSIRGLNGVDLNMAWRHGANAHLGLTVPGFPNLFMLYGPNTNLGHNSIVYMLESQIRYVIKAYERMRVNHANRVEVSQNVFSKYNRQIQSELAHTVWNGCKSWYIDERGHNSVQWPGFTLTYRWLTAFGRQSELIYSHTRHVDFPANVPLVSHRETGVFDSAMAVFLRNFLKLAFKLPIGKPFGVGVQRAVVKVLGPSMPGTFDALSYQETIGGIPGRVTVAKVGERRGAILYLHGGAFCLGGGTSHRSITSRLACETRLRVFSPDYRLAPEHPYPAAIDDALAAWNGLLAQGYAPRQIAVAGDSAGGSLALALALRLRQLGQPMPAALALISPMTDPTLSGSTLKSHAKVDPMVRQGWLEQGVQWFAAPTSASEFLPLEQSLKGLPPVLLHVGDEEILLADSARLASRLKADGVPCETHVFERRWHVFHLQAFYLSSARKALAQMGRFIGNRIVDISH